MVWRSSGGPAGGTRSMLRITCIYAGRAAFQRGDTARAAACGVCRREKAAVCEVWLFSFGCGVGPHFGSPVRSIPLPLHIAHTCVYTSVCIQVLQLTRTGRLSVALHLLHSSKLYPPHTILIHPHPHHPHHLHHSSPSPPSPTPPWCYLPSHCVPPLVQPRVILVTLVTLITLIA